MRFVLLFVLLVPLVTAWSQCGSPSERVVKIDSLDIETAIKDGQHWARITMQGTSSQPIPASAVIEKSVRMGGIRLPLPDSTLGKDLPAGSVTYQHEELFNAPTGLLTHVKLSVRTGQQTLLCIKDIEVQL